VVSYGATQGLGGLGCSSAGVTVLSAAMWEKRSRACIKASFDLGTTSLTSVT
jgi:hypothetical protein